MKQITPNDFLQGVESGIIVDVFAVGKRVYGKDPRGCANTDKIYVVVWADVP